MKTKMNLIAVLLMCCMLFSTSMLAQEKYNMVEITFMMPKIGMENSFENAVKEHNGLYHKEGPFKGSLDYITTGKQTGWYVWIMGPCTFTDLDNKPSSDAHNKHWEQKVAPTVAKYGSTEYWKHNPKISYKSGTETIKYEEIWFIDIKRGDSYRFNAFMEKIKAAFEKKGEGEMQVYENQFNEENGRDIAIVWGVGNYAGFDKNGSIKKEFEEINGEGSWDSALDEWEEFTVSVTSQLWKIGI
jgi:hypothetical protein